MCHILLARQQLTPEALGRNPSKPVVKYWLLNYILLFHRGLKLYAPF
jgi:hypothetical protein